MNLAACPSADVLAQLERGALPEPEAASVREHLRRCETCQALSSTLAGDRPSRRPTLETAAALAPLTRGTLVGRYVILQLLGSGAMGMVYEAVDPDLGRKIALKLLRTSRKDPESRTRLLREAQAMARLSHPNVVPVFDVGTTEAGDVFVAMERVDGQTLSEWCARQHDWRQILRYFLYAGRGLSAAHAAGLVHRDFKPHNVLVGADGRVRVTDFGLARSLAEPDGDPVSPSPPSPGTPPDALGAPLTREGAILGTPRYMSPEQLSGEQVDPRSDQFSFCVALYEALYRERPFGGDHLHVLLAQQKLDQVRDPPEGSVIPQRVRKALLRGLRSDPSARHPSMEALFAELALKAGPSWRQIAGVGAGAALIAALATVGVVRLRTPAPCAGVGDPFLGTWSAEAQRRVSSAFEATGKPFAREAFKALDRALTGYSEGAARTAQTTCAAARIQHQASEEVYARQAACLGQRERELKAFVELLAHADAETLALASTATDRLAPIADCTRLGALAIQTSPTQALHADEANTLFVTLADARAQNALGHYQDALGRIDRGLEGAPHLKETPLAAELLQQHARAESQLDHYPEAAADFERSALLSERYGDDAQAAHSWAERAGIETDLAHYPEAAQLLALARAKLDRLGSAPPEAEVTWLSASSGLAFQQGKYAEAASLLKRALELRQDHPAALSEGGLRERLGNADKALGDLDGAAREYTQAVALTERALGPKHPALTSMLGMLAGVRRRQGDLQAARALLERALTIEAEASGPDSLESARQLNNLALVDETEGNNVEALARLQRARHIKERALAADHPALATAWINEATALIPLHRLQEAEAALARAAEILIAAKGPSHPDLVAVYNNLGTVQRDQERFWPARESFSKAAEIARAHLGPKHPWLAVSLFGLGLTEISLDRFAQAGPVLEETLAIQEANHATQTDLAETQFALAEALWVSRSERRRSLALAKEALATGRKTPLPDGPTVQDMERWLSQHRAIWSAVAR